MIKDAAVAKQVGELMQELSERIRQSVALAEKGCPPEECAAYRRATQEILAAIDGELLGPLYAEHPALRPSGWTRVLRRPASARSLGGIIQPV
jgi:hypothetical protein